MAYKVLGQTTTVAPSTAAVAINLIGDPSFAAVAPEGTSFETQTAAYGQTYSYMNSPRWYYTAQNTTGLYLSNSTYNGVNAAFGVNSSAIGFRFGGGGGYSAWLGYGFTTSSTANLFDNSPSSMSTSKAMPVVGGTQYYFGYSLYVNDSNGASATHYVRWWDSTGTYISQNSANSNRNSATWTRTTNAYTAPSAAAYATIHWEVTFSSSPRYIYFDGVMFSTSNSLYTTFTEPSLPSTVAVTSPFDKKLNGYITETATATSSLTYAGPLQTLYTCPAGSSAVVSTITATNLISNSNTFRLVVQKSGETLAAKHFVVLDQSISGNSTEAFTIGITLNAGDMLKVAADTATVSFSAFGSEN
jgi:hypothetical protein